MSPPTDPHRPSPAGALLAVAALLVGFALARRPVAPPPRPAPSAVVLDAVIDLSRGAVDRSVLVSAPCRLDVSVESAGAVRVRFGPPAPAPRAGTAGPDPANTTELPASTNGRVGGSVLAYAAGIHVIRVEAVSPGTVASARIVVKRFPSSP